MIHVFRCTNNKCKHEFEVYFRTYKDFNAQQRCDKCGDWARKVFTSTHYIDVFQPYFSEHITDDTHPEGMHVLSRQHEKETFQRLGLHRKE